jgi:hypothetical protein
MSEDLKARLRDVVIETDYCGFSPLMDEAADYIERLENAIDVHKFRAKKADEALTQSRAETAAAYERAAERFEKIHAPLTYGEISSMIRALPTPNQSAALDAVRADAMSEAAEIATLVPTLITFTTALADECCADLSDVTMAVKIMPTGQEVAEISAQQVIEKLQAILAAIKGAAK